MTRIEISVVLKKDTAKEALELLVKDLHEILEDEDAMANLAAGIPVTLENEIIRGEEGLVEVTHI